MPSIEIYTRSDEWATTVRERIENVLTELGLKDDAMTRLRVEELERR